MNESAKKLFNEKEVALLFMKIIEIETSKLKPYELNAKTHSQTQIENVAESIKQFGFKQPIVVDKDYIIIIGHCRYEASKALGLEKVPCVIADDLTDEQVKKLRIIDNKTNESDWDLELLSEDIADLDFSDFVLDFGTTEDLDQPIEPKEREDLSDKIGETFQVIVDCKDEAEQEQLFNELSGGGYQCHILTL